MNIYATDLMTFLFILLCCLCTFLLLVIGFILYILGSQRVRQALLAMSLIKTAVDLVKDVFGAVKTVKKNSVKKSSTTDNKFNSKVVDAEFRDKNKV